MCRFMVYTMSVCRGERSELPLFGRAKRAPPVAQVGGEPYGKRIGGAKNPSTCDVAPVGLWLMLTAFLATKKKILVSQFVGVDPM